MIITTYSIYEIGGDFKLVKTVNSEQEAKDYVEYIYKCKAQGEILNPVYWVEDIMPLEHDIYYTPITKKPIKAQDLSDNHKYHIRMVERKQRHDKLTKLNTNK